MVEQPLYKAYKKVYKINNFSLPLHHMKTTPLYKGVF